MGYASRRPRGRNHLHTTANLKTARLPSVCRGPTFKTSSASHRLCCDVSSGVTWNLCVRELSTKVLLTRLVPLYRVIWLPTPPPPPPPPLPAAPPSTHRPDTCVALQVHGVEIELQAAALASDNNVNTDEVICDAGVVRALEFDLQSAQVSVSDNALALELNVSDSSLTANFLAAQALQVGAWVWLGFRWARGGLCRTVSHTRTLH